MAYLTLLGACSAPSIEDFRRDAKKLLKPSKMAGVSHFLITQLRGSRRPEVEPVGALVNLALDGGECLNPDLWHPLRVPCYHDPRATAEIAEKIDREMKSLEGRLDEWEMSELTRLITLFQHAASANECVVSALEAPLDAQRASRVALPWTFN